MTGKRIAWLALGVIIALAVSGCTGSLDSSTSSQYAAQTVGIYDSAGGYNCSCHAGVKTDWDQSRHANANTSPNPGSAPCDPCHDPIGDSQVMPAGNAVISCEACHGGAVNHAMASTTGPLFNPPPFPSPDYNRCGQCHNSGLPSWHISSFAQEGGNIVEDFLGSPHIRSVNSPVMVDVNRVRGMCSKCHTDQGARFYRSLPVDTVPSFMATPVFPADPVQCRTCHNGHNPNNLLRSADGSRSGEFHTCTSCHQAGLIFGLADAFHGESSDYSWSGSSAGVGEFDPSEIIYDTHFDNAVTSTIEGYNLGPLYNGDIGPLSDRVCRDCHNVHAADITINEQWTRSGHAGEIGEIKESADATNAQNILDAGVTDLEAPAFVQFDFKNPVFGQVTCQRCHTSTGAKNYLSDPSTYDPANNDFTYLDTTTERRELLYCWACHSDNSGGLREPAAIEAEYFDSLGSTVVFPDADGSNICISCHAGRQNGENVSANFDSTNDFGSYTPHYLAAGGILYGEIGYEYARTYDDPGFFEHNEIGTADSVGGELHPGTGLNGPCVGCHLDGDNANHLFSPLKLREDGSVEDVNDTCWSCHSPTGSFPFSLEKVEEEAAGFSNALDALSDALAAGSIFYVSDSHPYFYTTVSGGTAYTGWQDEQTLGAAFNLALLDKEPGAFAHNRFYTKRLIFDSIDYMDGAFDGTIDLTGYPDAAIWFRANLSNLATRP